MIKNGKYNYVLQLRLIVGFQNLVWVLIFIKISLCYDNKWEIKLGISVNIYCRLPKLAIPTHVFKISLCYVKKLEIKLCISVNIYSRLPKLGMSAHVFKIACAMMKNGK